MLAHAFSSLSLASRNLRRRASAFNILRQALALEGWMVAERQHAGLCCDVGPRFFEPIAGFAQFEAARVRLQHFEAGSRFGGLDGRGTAARWFVLRCWPTLFRAYRWLRAI